MKTTASLERLAADASPAMRANIHLALGRKMLNPKQHQPGIRMPKARKMNKGEQEYLAILQREFPGRKIKYEKFTFILESGLKYTADLTVWDAAILEMVVEVKGSRRLGSAGRSHLAFLTAAKEWPEVSFFYAKKNTDGSWSVTEVPR